MANEEATPAAEAAPVPPPPWRSVGRSTRSSGRPLLDRDRIVAVALGIVDAGGVDALTLRRLADELGVTPMSLYWYVADKAELLEFVGHAVLDEIELPAAAGDWQAQLRDVHLAMFDTFLRHPNTADILVGRARFGASGLAAFERILTILREAGFGSQAAFDAYQSLYLYTLGFMTFANRSAAFVEVQRQGWGYMQTLPEDTFPSIRVVTPVIGRRPLAEQLALGLDIVIAGIAGRLAPDEAGAGASLRVPRDGA